MATHSCKLMAAAFAALVMAPAQSTDKEARAESLLVDCTSKAPEADLACSAYLMGVLDGAVMMQAHKKEICLPQEGISGEQYRRIVVKWLEDRPKILHESKRLHAVLALIDAFPCKE